MRVVDQVRLQVVGGNGRAFAGETGQDADAVGQITLQIGARGGLLEFRLPGIRAGGLLVAVCAGGGEVVACQR
ncbi:hypothetical protein G6F55_014607 [Rhizopus delemar]|nr:hypothetical protein G6F55_014607 [Rhizopus delemar]